MYNGWVKKLLFVLGLALLFSAVTLTSIFGLFYHTYLYDFKKSSHLSNQEIVDLIQSGLDSELKQTHGKINVLVLGTDVVANRAGDPILTDTIVLLSLDLTTGKLRSLSFPRDLWVPSYKTKINSLYQYGKDRYPSEPQRFSTEVISELTEIPIHYTIVISLDQVQSLIDLLGGVLVGVPESFVDSQFPRTDVDIRTEKDPKKLYETVEFMEGTELMKGERALKFIRSRHSSNLEEGTDNARTARQQLIIHALLDKLKDRSTISNPMLVGKLYTWYVQNFNQQLSVKELIAIANVLREKLSQVAFESQLLSFETENTQGVIVHPPVSKYKQWVYEIRDLDQFKREVKEKLSIN